MKTINKTINHLIAVLFITLSFPLLADSRSTRANITINNYDNGCDYGTYNYYIASAPGLGRIDVCSIVIDLNDKNFADKANLTNIHSFKTTNPNIQFVDIYPDGGDGISEQSIYGGTVRNTPSQLIDNVIIWGDSSCSDPNNFVRLNVPYIPISECQSISTECASVGINFQIKEGFPGGTIDMPNFRFIFKRVGSDPSQKEEGTSNISNTDDVLPCLGSPPIARFTASPYEGFEPLRITLDASASNDNGVIVSYQWSANGGPPFATGPVVVNDFTAGTYTITLTVTDDQGISATTQQVITVGSKSVVPPVARLTAYPHEGIEPLRVTLDASASTDDGIIVSYQWSADGGSPFATGPVVVNDFTAGTYTIALTVTDNEGLTATTQQAITVSSKPVVPPVARLTASPDQGLAPLRVTLDGSASTDDGTIVSYQWSADGGAPFATGPVVVNDFTAGTYTITLTVTDDQGLTGTATATITAEQPEPPPPSTGVGQAIILASGGAHRENTLFRYSNQFTQRMYRILTQRGFEDGDIHYINPWPPDIDLDGYPDDDRHDYKLFDPDKEIAAAFAQAAANLQAGQQFIFYLHGHARIDHFSVMPTLGYELSASRVRELLATLPVGVQQVIILNSCYSGSFMDELAGVDNRIVVSSTDDRSGDWSTQYGSFADTFLSNLRRAESVEQAFLYGLHTIAKDRRYFRNQTPWLDDDRDGMYTSNDGRLAAGAYIGVEGTRAAPAPSITLVHDRIVLSQNEASATLWVKVTPAQDQIHQVQAAIINPHFVAQDYQGQATDFTREDVDLIYNAAQKRYEIAYDGFFTAGTWQILYQAQGIDGAWSEIADGEVQAQGVASPATVKMMMNKGRYTAGEQLRLDMQVNGKMTADLYVAIVFPDGDYITIAHPLNFSWPNAIQAYQKNVEIAGQRTYPIMDFPLPGGIALGDYQACGVLVEAGNEPNNQANWVHIHCAGFEVY